MTAKATRRPKRPDPTPRTAAQDQQRDLGMRACVAHDRDTVLFRIAVLVHSAEPGVWLGP